MPRRRAWNGSPPESAAAARRVLLDAARACVDRKGLSNATLGDVAEAAGVTRQTVYRYFEDTQDLFNSAAALSSGGFLERLRRRVRKQQGLANRVVECMVFAIVNLPRDPHLVSLTTSRDRIALPLLLDLRFVQEEVGVVSDGNHGLTSKQLDELAELLLRLMQSFLTEAGPPRSEQQLRSLLRGWLSPVIEAHLRRAA